VLSIVLAILLWAGLEVVRAGGGHALDQAIVIVAFFPAVAAAITYYLEKRAYESHVRRYRLTAALYRRANAAFGGAITAGNARRIGSLLAALGREALAENGDWVLLHRERHVEPPTGG